MDFRRALGPAAACLALVACSANASSPARTEDAGSRSVHQADVRAIESDLRRQIDEKLGVQGSRVECPGVVSWRVSDSFRCSVTAAGFPPGIAVITLEAENGRYGWYLTNTCDGESAAGATPAPDCTTPDPSSPSDCTYENGRLECPSKPARP